MYYEYDDIWKLYYDDKRSGWMYDFLCGYIIFKGKKLIIITKNDLYKKIVSLKFI